MTAHLSEDDIIEIAYDLREPPVHARECPECAEHLSAYRETLTAVRLKAVPPASVLNAIRQAARKKERPFFYWPAWGGALTTAAVVLLLMHLPPNRTVLQKKIVSEREVMDLPEIASAISVQPPMELQAPGAPAPELRAFAAPPARIVFADQASSAGIDEAVDEAGAFRPEGRLAAFTQTAGPEVRARAPLSLNQALLLEKDGKVAEALETYRLLWASPPDGIEPERILTDWIFCLHRAGREEEANEKKKWLRRINPSWEREHDLRW